VNAALARVAALVEAASGIAFRETDHAALRKAIARATGADPSEFLALVSDPDTREAAIDRLVGEVTVKETYFLRERQQLESIDWLHALEQADGGTLRVWDAACATGEEAYSLALLAAEALGARASATVRILATDIAADALVHAREGLYRARAVREVDPHLRARCLREESGRFAVADSLRSLVTFARHNLVGDPIPPLGEAPFDLVVCRNVLIYFGAETAARVVEALEGALRPGGTLLLGAADVLCVGPSRREQPPAPAPAARRAARRPVAKAARAPRAAKSRVDVQAAEPLDAEIHFLTGMAELESERLERAIASFRRALYVDPGFGLAAFQLGRAYEAAGDRPAARRSYSQALRAIQAGDGRYDQLLGQVDPIDVVVACRVRLAFLSDDEGARGVVLASEGR